MKKFSLSSKPLSGEVSMIKISPGISCFLFVSLQGFRKIDPDKWEFANEAFQRGQRHLLKNIRRRKASAQSLPSQHYEQESSQEIGPCVEVGRFVLNSEVDSLRRDKHLLMMELVKLRQQQQSSRAYLHEMELRLQATEQKQQQMMSFLARVMQNPDFIDQLIQQKKRRVIEAGELSYRIKAEPLEYGQVSELEALALEMQGFGRARREQEDDDEELDEGFWQELLSEGFHWHGEDDENVDVLADRLGFLGSSPRKRANK